MNKSNATGPMQVPRYTVSIQCNVGVARDIYKMTNLRRGVTIELTVNGVKLAGPNREDVLEGSLHFIKLCEAKERDCDHLVIHFPTKAPSTETLRTQTIHSGSQPPSTATVGTSNEIASGTGSETIYLERVPGALLFSEIVVPFKTLEPALEQIDSLQNSRTRLKYEDHSLKILTTSRDNGAAVESKVRRIIEEQLKGLSNSNFTPIISYDVAMLVQSMSPEDRSEYDRMKSHLSNSEIVLESAPNRLSAQEPKQVESGGATEISESDGEDLSTDSSHRISSGGENKKRVKKQKKKKKKKKDAKTPKKAPAKPAAPVTKKKDPPQAAAVRYNVPRHIDYTNVSDIPPAQHITETELFRASDGSLHPKGSLHDGLVIKPDLSTLSDDEEVETVLPQKTATKTLPNASALAESPKPPIDKKRKRREELGKSPDRGRKMVKMAMKSFEHLKPSIPQKEPASVKTTTPVPTPQQTPRSQTLKTPRAPPDQKSDLLTRDRGTVVGELADRKKTAGTGPGVNNGPPQITIQIPTPSSQTPKTLRAPSNQNFDQLSRDRDTTVEELAARESVRSTLIRRPSSIRQTAPTTPAVRSSPNTPVPKKLTTNSLFLNAPTK